MMAHTNGYLTFTVYLVLVFAVNNLWCATFSSPSSNQDLYVHENKDATFSLKYTLNSRDGEKEGVARIDCGFVNDAMDISNRFLILLSKLGPTKAKLNDEDFPPEYKGRVNVLEHEEGEIRFKITSVTDKDQRKFVCRMFYWQKSIYNLKRPINSPFITLKIIKPITAVRCLEKQEFDVIEGKAAEFYCQVDAVPSPSVKCSILDKDNQVIQSAQSEGSNVTLYVKSSTPSMHKVICTAKQKFVKEFSLTKIIKVQGVPKDTSLLLLTKEPRTNDLIVLKCMFSAYPEVSQVSFFKDNQVMASFATNTYKFIPTTCAQYTGKYHCEVKNSMGIGKSQTKEITVSEPPKVALVNPNVATALGKDVSLNCKASGCPKPFFKWFKEGNTDFKREGPSLQLSNIKLEDIGKYTCMAINREGVSNSTVVISASYKPMRGSLTSNAVQGRIRAGHNLELHCRSQAHPSPFYSLYKNKELLVENESGKAIVKSLTCETDGGNYTCIPENSQGKGDELSMWIYVEDKPTIVKSPRSHTVNISSSVELTCMAEGCPKPKIVWKKKGMNAVIHRGNTLTIRNIQATDATKYTCIATNRVGETQAISVISIASQKAKQTNPDNNNGNSLAGLFSLITLPTIIFWKITYS